MNKNKILGIVIALLLIIPITYSISFLLNPIINSGSTTYTTDDLICQWSYSADTVNQTINWYKNDVLNLTIFQNTSLTTNYTLESSNTSKNEEWKCEIILRNVTSSTTRSTTTTIENIAPLTPKMYNGSTRLLGTIQVTEDETYNFVVNSTDPDEDTLTYYAEPSEASSYFCTITNSATGAMTCTPTQDDITANDPKEMNMTFWASDYPSNPSNAKAASNKFLFNITPVNDPPSISFGSGHQVSVTDTFNESFTITDEEGDTNNNVSLDIVNTDSEIVNDVYIGLNSGTELWVAYYTSPPDYNDVGNRTISINVSDSNGAWQLQSFNLTITSVNRQGYFTNITPSSPYELAQGENITINISSSDLDVTDYYNETSVLTVNDTRFNVTNIVSLVTNTSNALAQINFTATPQDVGIIYLLVTITDSGSLTNTTILTFNVTNINDAPIIYNESYHSSNTANNLYLYNLTAYANSPFEYHANWTDYDLPLGDAIDFTDNTSLFNITSGGVIIFTPEELNIGNYSILITATDSQVSSTSAIINLTIYNNSNPIFTSPIPDINCTEELLCNYNISNITTDNDGGDYVADYQASLVNSTNNLTLNINLNSTTGLINFTPIQDNIGDYVFNITIYDSYGASTSRLMNLSINNSIDDPVFTRYDFSSETIVETKTFTYQLRVQDEDLDFPSLGENITITSNMTGFTFQDLQVINDTYFAFLTYTPSLGTAGTHTVEINATDNFSRVDTKQINFTILPKTDAPQINEFNPYPDTNNISYYLATWTNTSGYSNNEVFIRINENNSNVLFGISVTDDYTPYNQLTYKWYYDSSLISGATSNITYRDFDFYESGTHNVTVIVNDTTLESSRWTWIMDVMNVNQVPVLVNDLWDNISVNQITSYPNYFKNFAGDNGSSEVKFYDADDDTNEDGVISGSETQNLVYTYTDCSVASIDTSNSGLEITPIEEGTCQVIFTATDSAGATAESNVVNITVTAVPEGSSTNPSTSTGGGGGGAATTPQMIPISNDVEVPKPLRVISPEVAMTYENRTIKIPIEIMNNWTDKINGISLDVELAEELKDKIEYSFNSNYIESLDVNQSTNVTLVVTGYRLGENFELKVLANSSDPEFQDESLVLFNSIEKGSDEKQMESKVTFAQDLLSENSECQELAELLKKAQEYMNQGNLAEAAKYLDVTINGCKYLISKTSPDEERPSLLNPSFELNEKTLYFLAYLSLIIIGIAAVLIIFAYHFKNKEEYDF